MARFSRATVCQLVESWIENRTPALTERDKIEREILDCLLDEIAEHKGNGDGSVSRVRYTPDVAEDRPYPKPVAVVPPLGKPQPWAPPLRVEGCYACGKKLGRNPHRADTRDDQWVFVGSECYKEIKAAGEQGWRYAHGGPRLYLLPPMPPGGNTNPEYVKHVDVLEGRLSPRQAGYR